MFQDRSTPSTPPGHAKVTTSLPLASTTFTPAAPSSMRRLAMTALVSFAAVAGVSQSAMAQFTTTDKLLPERSVALLSLQLR